MLALLLADEDECELVGGGAVSLGGSVFRLDVWGDASLPLAHHGAHPAGEGGDPERVAGHAHGEWREAVGAVPRGQVVEVVAEGVVLGHEARVEQARHVAVPAGYAVFMQVEHDGVEGHVVEEVELVVILRAFGFLELCIGAVAHFGAVLKQVVAHFVVLLEELLDLRGVGLQLLGVGGGCGGVCGDGLGGVGGRCGIGVCMPLRGGGAMALGGGPDAAFAEFLDDGDHHFGGEVGAACQHFFHFAEDVAQRGGKGIVVFHLFSWFAIVVGRLVRLLVEWCCKVGDFFRNGQALCRAGGTNVTRWGGSDSKSGLLRARYRGLCLLLSLVTLGAVVLLRYRGGAFTVPRWCSYGTVVVFEKVWDLFFGGLRFVEK